jgi:probable F420-dependent oxidoreductase
MQITLSMRRIHEWFDGEIAPAVGVAKRAEAAGIDQISVVDHILMGEDFSGYPYGKFEFDRLVPWWEPVTVLAALASATERIRLSTSVIVSPLRPAVFLAKQLTTLDHLAGGRVDIGLGVGWQKAEYDAAGVAWENRFSQMEEQIRACKLLWTEAPATFQGKYTSFSQVHQRPFPVQAGGLPIWLGVNDSDRSLARVADLAEGWCPPNNDPAKLAAALAKLHRAFTDRGRDPRSLKTRVVLPAEMGKDGPDLRASVAHIPTFEKLGITNLEIAPAVFYRSADDLDQFLDVVNSAR